MQETEIIANFSRLLFSEMVFIDLGADASQYTYQVNKNVNKSSIYSYEEITAKAEIVNFLFVSVA